MKSENFWHGVYANMPESQKPCFSSIQEADKISQEIRIKKFEIEKLEQELEAYELQIISDLCDYWSSSEIKEGIKEFFKNNYNMERER